MNKNEIEAIQSLLEKNKIKGKAYIFCVMDDIWQVQTLFQATTVEMCFMSKVVEQLSLSHLGRPHIEPSKPVLPIAPQP